jgi:lipid II:glycine glycyltransferase (peptidoglycan interpeptide bridge formation enzyme)
MIAVRRAKFGLPYLQKWFAREFRTRDLLAVAAYRQFLGDTPGRFWIRRPFFTSIIDLKRTEEKIFSDIHKEDRSKINRSDREGLGWIGTDSPSASDINDFIVRYRAFAQEKNIAPVTRSQLDSFSSSLFLSQAVLEDKVLAWHLYLVDRDEGRARFLYGLSERFAPGSDANLVGRANRWCHWQDMRNFKAQGLAIFDFGGIALDTDDPALRGINQFKLRFGGVVTREDHWVSPLYALAEKLARL